MDLYLSLHFSERIEVIRQLCKSDRIFKEICTEFEVIAEEKERVEAVVIKISSEDSSIRELLDLGNTLDGLRLEIQQRIANANTVKR